MIGTKTSKSVRKRNNDISRLIIIYHFLDMSLDSRVIPKIIAVTRDRPRLQTKYPKKSLDECLSIKKKTINGEPGR